MGGSIMRADTGPVRLVVLMTALAVLPFPVEGESRFVGVKTCRRCHDGEGRGNAVRKWEASHHAQALSTLKAHTENAARMCQDLPLWIVEIGRGVRYGLPRPAAESKECLPCHATAFGAAKQSVAPSFEPKDGVQCESCHGPGSAHVEAASAAQGAKAAAGLRRFEDQRAIEELCRTCHDGTCGDFDFAAMWPKVRHSSSRRPPS